MGSFLIIESGYKMKTRCQAAVFMNRLASREPIKGLSGMKGALRHLMAEPSTRLCFRALFFLLNIRFSIRRFVFLSFFPCLSNFLIVREIFG